MIRLWHIDCVIAVAFGVLCGWYIPNEEHGILGVLVAGIGAAAFSGFAHHEYRALQREKQPCDPQVRGYVCALYDGHAGKHLLMRDVVDPDA